MHVRAISQNELNMSESDDGEQIWSSVQNIVGIDEWVVYVWNENISDSKMTKA